MTKRCILYLMVCLLINCFFPKQTVSAEELEKLTINGKEPVTSFMHIVIGEKKARNEKGKSVTLNYPVFINEKGEAMISIEDIPVLWEGPHFPGDIIFDKETGKGSCRLLDKINGDKDVFYFEAGKDSFLFQGKEIKLSSPIEKKEETVFLPLRQFLQLSGISENRIHWDSEKKEILIEYGYSLETNHITITYFVGDLIFGTEGRSEIIYVLEITDKNEIQNLISICNNDFQETNHYYQGSVDVVIDFHNGTFLTLMTGTGQGNIGTFIEGTANMIVPEKLEEYIVQLKQKYALSLVEEFI